MARSANSNGNPIMILPILAVLAWLDLETNQGRNIAALVALWQWVSAISFAPSVPQVTGQLSALVTLAIIGGAVVVIGMGIKNRLDGRQLAATVAGLNHGRRVTRMPSGMPPRLTATIADVLTVRGGVDAQNQPLFWLDGNGSMVTPLAWTLAVDYANGVEPSKLDKFVPDIENRLYGAGFDVQVRVTDRPLALQIDNPTPPLFALHEFWNQIQALSRDERLCAPAVQPSAKGMQLVQLPLRNMGAGTLVAGMPGAGKTQFILSAILSLCMANSPQRLSLIIADVKAADTMPLSGLPHLACPVVTSPDEIVSVLDALVAEMEQRMLRSAAGDRTWMQHSICLVVDEVAELIVGNGSRGELVAQSIQRLSQAGRGMGIILLIATQRVFEVPAKVYSKLDRRCVFRVASAGDSVAASGSEGTRCNKLPKRGALEIFSAGDPTAQRAQGLFVADAEAADYESILAGYVGDINARWGNQAPGWVYVPSAKPVQVEPVEDDSEADSVEDGTVFGLSAKYGDAFVDALVALGDEGKLSAKAVERTYQEMFGKSMNSATRRSIRKIIMRDFE